METKILLLLPCQQLHFSNNLQHFIGLNTLGVSNLGPTSSSLDFEAGQEKERGGEEIRSGVIEVIEGSDKLLG